MTRFRYSRRPRTCTSASRVGIDTLQRDLLMAGAGMYAAGSVGPLHQALAAGHAVSRIWQRLRRRQRHVLQDRRDQSVVRPSTASQTTLAARAAGGLARHQRRESTRRVLAATASQVCGLRGRRSIARFRSHGRVGRVRRRSRRWCGGVATDGPAPARVNLPRARTSPRSTAVTYALKADPASGAYQLVRAEALDPAQPVLDHVVKLEFQYFGEPLPPRLDRREARASLGPVTDPHLRHPGEAVAGWPPGENCTFALVDGQHQTRLTPLGVAGAAVEIAPAILTDGPWCPDAGARNRFDADLLRIRRVRSRFACRRRLPSLRGPAGVLFTNGGIEHARRSLCARSRDPIRCHAAQFESGTRNLEPGTMKPESSGVALILVLLVMMTLSALAMSLALMVSTESRVSANYRDGMEALYGAEAALERVLPDLAAESDFKRVLTGASASSFVDGPAGTAQAAGRHVHGSARAHVMLNCGRVVCRSVDLDEASEERPWGRNNPRWQLFGYGPSTALGASGPTRASTLSSGSPTTPPRPTWTPWQTAGRGVRRIQAAAD